MNTYSVVDLGGLAADGSCVPHAIARAGHQITGASNGLPFSWDGSSTQPVPLLNGFSGGQGSAVNSRGDIVSELFGMPAAHAFVKPANAPGIDLHLKLPGQPEFNGSYAVDVNDSGPSLASSCGKANSTRGFTRAGR
jgi:hypothetical protein